MLLQENPVRAHRVRLAGIPVSEVCFGTEHINRSVPEFGAGILEDAALPSIEIIPRAGFYDYENKYQPGAAVEVCPAEISPETEEKLRAAALRVYETLGLSVYSRADFIVDEDGEPWFLEINTLPGMTPTSLLPQEAAAVGIDYGALVERIVLASLAARKQGR